MLKCHLTYNIDNVIKWHKSCFCGILLPPCASVRKSEPAPLLLSHSMAMPVERLNGYGTDSFHGIQ